MFESPPVREVIVLSLATVLCFPAGSDATLPKRLTFVPSNGAQLVQGVNVKTRKRNVAVPHDPAGFAESVLTLLGIKCSEVEGTTEKLAAAVKALDGSNLDFSRYGVELFEIFFAGARMGIGTKLADDTKSKIDWNVRDSPIW